MKIWRMTFVMGLVILLTIPFASNITTIAPVEYHSESDVLNTRFFQDVHLTHSPNFYEEGTVDEFEYDHESVSENQGMVRLKWNHTAGTELQYSDIENPKPACLDFVYFSYNISYDYEFMPLDANCTIQYSIEMTGSFETENASELMYNIYIWGVDSSGDWKRIYKSNAPYSNDFERFEIDLSYFELLSIFDGMVEDDGVQEDPEDSFSLAVGLAPSANFEEYLGSYPWQEYNGSVQVSFNFLDLHLIEDYGHDIPREQCIYNNSISVDPVFTYQDDLVVNEAGNVYISGEYRSEINDSISVMKPGVTKWSPDCNFIWQVNISVFWGRFQSLVVDNNFNLFAAGIGRISDDSTSNQFLLAKISGDGTLLWVKEILNENVHDPTYCYIDTSSDGKVYGIASYLTQISYNSTIFCMNEDGTVDWTKALGESVQKPLIKVIDTGGIFVNAAGLSKFDISGNTLWNLEVPVLDMDVIPTGDVFTIWENDNNSISLTKISTEGAILEQELIHQFHYRETPFTIFQKPQIECDYQGNIAVLTNWLFHYSYNILFKYDSDLNQIWNKTLDLDKQLPDTAMIVAGPMDVSVNGNIYMGLQGRLGFSSPNFGIFPVYAYSFSESSQSIFTEPMAPIVFLGLTIAIASVGIIAIVALVIVKKNR